MTPWTVKTLAVPWDLPHNSLRHAASFLQHCLGMVLMLGLGQGMHGVGRATAVTACSYGTTYMPPAIKVPFTTSTMVVPLPLVAD